MIIVEVDMVDGIVVIHEITEATAEVEAEAEIAMIVEGAGIVQTVIDEEAGVETEVIAGIEDEAEDQGVDQTIGVSIVTEGIKDEMAVSALTDIEMIVTETATIGETTIATTVIAVNKVADAKREEDVMAEGMAKTKSPKTKKSKRSQTTSQLKAKTIK